MSQWNLKQTVAPTVEPVSVAELKTHMNLVGSADDTLLAVLEEAARVAIENETNRQLITATYTLTLAGQFPADIVLPRPPFQSVSSVQYVDTNGDTQTLSSSVYTTYEQYGVAHLIEDYLEDFPTTRSIENAITITYLAGYGAAATAVPEPLRVAVMMLAADLYEHREAQAEIRLDANTTVRRLITPYRIIEV